MNNTLKSQNREQTSCKGCKSKHTVTDHITTALPVKYEVAHEHSIKGILGKWKYSTMFNVLLTVHRNVSV
jgi:hypothetical protein